MSIAKISHKDAVKSTTMFLVDDRIEKKYKNLIAIELDKYKKSMLGITTKQGIADFIKSNVKSVDMLLTVLGVSKEKFRRIVSTIRLNQGYIVEGEWDEARLRKELVQRPSMMDDFCELFLHGNDIEKFNSLIPQFILQDFHIDRDVIVRLCSDDMLSNLVKKKLSTSYNKAYADLYARRMNEKISTIAKSYGLEYLNSSIETVSKEDIHHLTDGEKNIIINFQFNLTTSSAQTNYADKTIAPIYRKCRVLDNVIVINMLDGAGWIARASDMKKVYQDCNYYLNLRTIEILNEIIKDFYKI